MFRKPRPQAVIDSLCTLEPDLNLYYSDPYKPLSSPTWPTHLFHPRAVQAVAMENKVTPVLTELQRALKDKQGNEGTSGAPLPSSVTPKPKGKAKAKSKANAKAAK